MTACRAWSRRLVVAAPEELSGTAETDLSRHIRGCPRCASEARRIAAAAEALRMAMSSPEVDAARLIERARHAGADERNIRGRQWVGVPRAAWSGIAASMAAAAVVAVLFLKPPPMEPLMPFVPLQPLVHAADYNLVVMPTRNPDITILWFYKETEE